MQSYATASQGPQGFQGFQGPAGPTGLGPAILVRDVFNNIVQVNQGVQGSQGIQGAQGSASAEDGWTAANETWTYASSTTFTIVGDATSKYQKGDKLRLVQTTTKYFYVIGISFGGVDTTVTVTGGSDYSIANASITAPHFSHIENPVGFPQWLNWTPTYTGFSANPTGLIHRFKINGTTCTIAVRNVVNGTSNSTSFSFTLPVTAKTITDMFWHAPATGINNGSTITAPVCMEIASAATSVVLLTGYGASATNWSSSNGKRIGTGSISYEI